MHVRAGPVIDEPEMPDANMHLDRTQVRFTELTIPVRSILAEATRASGRSGVLNPAHSMYCESSA